MFKEWWEWNDKIHIANIKIMILFPKYQESLKIIKDKKNKNLIELVETTLLLLGQDMMIVR